MTFACGYGMPGIYTGLAGTTTAFACSLLRTENATGTRPPLILGWYAANPTTGCGSASAAKG